MVNVTPIAHVATGTSFLALWQFDLKVNYNSVTRLLLLLLEVKGVTFRAFRPARDSLRADLSDALRDVFTGR